MDSDPYFQSLIASYTPGSCHPFFFVAEMFQTTYHLIRSPLNLFKAIDVPGTVGCPNLYTVFQVSSHSVVKESDAFII